MAVAILFEMTAKNHARDNPYIGMSVRVQKKQQFFQPACGFAASSSIIRPLCLDAAPSLEWFTTG
jgi:hypothetical protein